MTVNTNQYMKTLADSDAAWRKVEIWVLNIMHATLS